MSPTELLPRFAACSQWLAEEHPDAPRFPEWICIGDPARYSCVTECVDGECDDDCKIYNPDACLAGAVVWAMEVAGWWQDTYAKSVQVTPFCMEDGTKDFQWLMQVEDRRAIPKFSGFDLESNLAPTKEQAWASVLESICTVLGREG